MDSDKPTESALNFVARCCAAGDSRADIAESLQKFYGVSRATAYRMIARHLCGTDTAESPDIARREDGGIDLAAEAARQYAAAVKSDDSKSALRWFNVLQRLAA